MRQPFDSGLYGIAKFSGTYVSVNVEKTLVEQWLPPALELDRQWLTAEERHHPVMLFFTRYHDFHLANARIVRLSDYKECALSIPYTRWKEDKQPYRGPFVFPATLFLNRLLPTVMGRLLYGLPKHVASIESSETTYSVKRGNTQLVQAEFTPTENGEFESPSQFPLFDKYAPSLMQQPLVGRVIDGLYRCSVLDPQVTDMTIRPVEAKLHIAAEFAPGWKNLDLVTPRIDQSALGAFQFETTARFSLPMSPYSVPENPLGWRTKRLGKPAETLKRKKKIAILGGGVGAVVTALNLTDEKINPNWKEEYEIDLYQLGWRLGGKGASGRNEKDCDRIEEHGIHFWWGHYQNAFRLLRDCYADPDRGPSGILKTWRDAFTPQNVVLLMEKYKGKWYPWAYNFPRNDGEPGDGTLYQTPWNIVMQILRWFLRYFYKSRDILLSRNNRFVVVLAGLLLFLVGWLARPVLWLMQLAFRDAEQHQWGANYRITLWALKWIRAKVWQKTDGQVDDLRVRRLAIILDMALTSVIGILNDRIVARGFGCVDDEDYRAWFRRHGAHELTVASPNIGGLYAAVFAYKDGHTDLENQSLMAGVSLRGALRMILAYKDAPMYKMNAGMGDVVFAPMYRVLENRGVRFHFFHRVDRLELTEDHRSIGKIHMGIQAKVKDGEKYDALFDGPCGIPCWPDQPRYKYLEDADQLKGYTNNLNNNNKVTLESFWNTWPDKGGPLTLTLADPDSDEAGADEFDQVVLGISLGAFPFICKDLINANERWRGMVDNIGTVQTQGLQLWLKPDLKELGWPDGMTKFPDVPPILTEYAQDLNTWADMPQLIDVENWPVGGKPGTIAYFCGPLKDEPGKIIPPGDDESFPYERDEQVKKDCIRWLQDNTASLWPRATNSASGHSDDPHPEGFNWDLLCAPDGTSRQDRFAAQFWRANIDPSERYVQSAAGTRKYRMDAGDSGFDNLYLAGDSVNTILNVGCVEAATMAGMAASRAICGEPRVILGEHDILLEKLRVHHSLMHLALKAIHKVWRRIFGGKIPPHRSPHEES